MTDNAFRQKIESVSNIAEAIREAEKCIQKTLLDLHDVLGVRIDHVDVDTRNFSNFETSIFIVAESPKYD